MADHTEHDDQYGYTFKLTVKKEDAEDAWKAAKEGFEIYVENSEEEEISLFVWAGKIGPPPPPPPPTGP